MWPAHVGFFGHAITFDARDAHDAQNAVAQSLRNRKDDLHTFSFSGNQSINHDGSVLIQKSHG